MPNILATMLQSLPGQGTAPVYTDNVSIWHHMSDALLSLSPWLSSR